MEELLRKSRKVGPRQEPWGTPMPRWTEPPSFKREVLFSSFKVIFDELKGCTPKSSGILGTYCFVLIYFTRKTLTSFFFLLHLHLEIYTTRV